MSYRPSTICLSFLRFAACLILTGTLRAEVQTTVEFSESGLGFQFETVPLPAIDDSCANGKWKVLAGRVDANSGGIATLSDALVPTSEDQPSKNFFFAAGTAGGVITVDLGELREISEVVSYSWHSDSRAPQVYSVYAATGAEAGFEFPDTRDAVSSIQAWKKLADVDTRSENRRGGQHAARIFDPDMPLGKFRHLLFVVNETEAGNPFSNTFFSEIDVVITNSQQLQRMSAPVPRELEFTTADASFRFTIDLTQALELEQWTEKELKPVIQEWYPKIVAMLPSEGFEAAHHVRFRYLRDAEMKGIPAYASGNTISMNAEWFRGQLDGEARGAVVHEMVHVVQKYPGRNRRPQGVAAPPGWIVEGIPDYVRWFLYEPETGGAKLSPQKLRNAKHDASYRTSANFIDWVIRNDEGDGKLLERLNAAARQGKYSADTWKELTGMSEQELVEAWRTGL